MAEPHTRLAIRRTGSLIFSAVWPLLVAPRDLANRLGYVARLVSTTSLSSEDDYNAVEDVATADIVLGVHAFRSGRWILSLQRPPPFALIFGGTDLNEDVLDVYKMATMTQAVRRADSLIAFNQPLKQRALELWPECIGKLVVIPQGVTTLVIRGDLDPYAPIRHLFETDVEKLRLFVLPAGLRPVKDVLFLVDAFAKWHAAEPDVRMIIVGPVLDSDYAQSVEAHVALLAGVHVLRCLPREQLLALVNVATALLNSSLSEGMSGAILEAMQLRVPVLARDIPGNRALLPAGMAGLFDTPLACISQARQLPASTSANVEAAALHVTKYHSLAAEEAAYAQILNRLNVLAQGRKLPSVCLCCAIQVAVDAVPSAITEQLQLVLDRGTREVLSTRLFPQRMSSPDCDDFDLLVTMRVALNGRPGLLLEDESAIVRLLQGLDGVVSAEVILTAPCAVPILSLTLDTATVAGMVRLPSLVRRFLHTGLLVQRSAVSDSDLRRLDDLVQPHIARADAALLERGVDLGIQQLTLMEISTRGLHRFDLLIDVEADAWLQQWCHTGPWVPLIKALLGPDLQVDLSVIYSRPGADDQEWHSDGAHLGNLVAGWGGYGHSAPYAVCVFVPLINLTPELGCTQFWPGSHKHEQLLGFGPAAPILHCTVEAYVPAGHAVLYDYRLMHRGRGNSSSATERRIMQLLYHSRAYQEDKNFGSDSLFNTPAS